MDRQIDRLVLVETASSVCWFFMDSCWMLGLPTLAKVLAVLTIVTSLLIFAYTECSLSNMLVTAAMASWAFMNVLWMLNDLKSLPWGLAGAKIFCLTGAFCLLAAFLAGKNNREALDNILARFRRLRIRRTSPSKPNVCPKPPDKPNIRAQQSPQHCPDRF